MLDLHTHPDNWGIMPTLFNIYNFEVNSYSFFVLLGLIVGLIVYYILAKKEKELSENSFYILIAGLVGGVLGAKLPILLINLPDIIKNFPDITYILAGRTITGGLLGGTLAVWYVKKKLAIKEKKGNLFAPAIALGVAIGRIGCFLRGCCYGIPTNLPWGINFGDNIPRHPTQIYETIFMLIMFPILLYKRKTANPGYLFYLLMNSYFIFRFFEEFIRENPHYFGLTLFQYISLIALVFINLKHLKEKRYEQSQ
ncbi:MAG: prolipoprotein diacylglyceryl transferase [Patescibacteria group bacterium]|nr:prolipoprotein diacylglyceryl transferase [Patescibacteria group bacterium]